MSARGPMACRILLGREIRRLRERAGVPREEVASRLGWDLSKVSRTELGRRLIRAPEVNQLLELLGAEPAECERLREIGRRSRVRATHESVPERFRQYHGLQIDAVSQKCYEGELVPDLLQTLDYATAVTVSMNRREARRLIDARIRRQRSLLGEGKPLKLQVVLGEACLYREVGGREVMAGQLDRLIELAELAQVQVRVLPFSAGGHGALGHGFTLLTLDLGGELDTWLYLEGMTRTDMVADPEHVVPYEVEFGTLAAKSLSCGESLTLLRRTRWGRMV